MIYPKRLKKNDFIGICSPASPVRKLEFHKGMEFLNQLGLQIKLSKNVYKKDAYLAGTDAERLEDFHELLLDPAVKAIIFARGGYGSARFATNIDFDIIKNNPKIIWGFSDITYLHNLIYAKTKLITFHGPMVMTAGQTGFDKTSKQGFDQLFRPTIRRYDESISPLRVIVPGEVSAPIIGGNLSLIVRSLGTQAEINMHGKILFIEDINENIYKIDAMLNQLKLANKLVEVAGIVIGDFHNVSVKVNDELENAEVTAEMLFDLFTHYFNSLKVPVLAGFKIGHCFPHFAIPHGAMAQLSTTNKTLIIEAGVK